MLPLSLPEVSLRSLTLNARVCFSHASMLSSPRERAQRNALLITVVLQSVKYMLQRPRASFPADLYARFLYK